MSATLNISAPESVVVHFDPLKLLMDDNEYFKFCQVNADLRIERTSEGDIIIMPPTGGTTGILNANLIAAFGIWSKKNASGKFFDSSTEFILPNRAGRSPDLSWVRIERWQALTDEEQEQFPPLCPDFVVELRSRTDSIKDLKAKMEEYTANGAQLGWLIDPMERKVHVYRPGVAPEILDNPETVSGEPLLKGFVLDVREIWD